MPDINVQYIVAVMLLDRTATLQAAHDVERRQDPKVLEMRGRVELLGDDAHATLRVREFLTMLFVPRLVFMLVCAFMLSACTPQAALIASLIPQSTLNVALGNLDIMLGCLERVSDENRKRVAELEQRGDWKGLASLAERNLRSDRSNADWWLIAGYARSQLNDYKAAAEAYGEVLRLEPDNPAGWHLLAQSYRGAGDSKRAVNLLNNALLALRDSPITYYLLGESYADIERDDEAVTAYRAAVKIEERFPAAWFALAKAYGRLGRAVDAREAQARLEKLDPKLAQRLREGS